MLEEISEFYENYRRFSHLYSTASKPSCSVIEQDFMITDDTFAMVTSNLALQTPEAKTFLRIALENVKLFDRKNADYGNRNISGFGTFGVFVRMNDKFERIKNLIKFKTIDRSIAVTFTFPENEGLEDTLRDIANYALIAVMIEKGLWPGVEGLEETVVTEKQ